MAPEPAALGRAQAVVGPALAHRQELHDALLDLVEAGVVGVEDGLGVGQVEVVVDPRRPTAAR